MFFWLSVQSNNQYYYQKAEIVLLIYIKKQNLFKICTEYNMYGCAVSWQCVDSTTTMLCVTHLMLIAITTHSEVKL